MEYTLAQPGLTVCHATTVLTVLDCVLDRLLDADIADSNNDCSRAISLRPAPAMVNISSTVCSAAGDLAIATNGTGWRGTCDAHRHAGQP